MQKTPSIVAAKDFIPEIVRVFRQGYTRAQLGKDLVGGFTVGVVALPLALAFAIGAGANPSQGLWTAIIAGFFSSLLGGGRFQISGPTGAFVVVISGVVSLHGMDGLITATFLGGLILLIFGLSGLGKLIKYIPYPVTTGFTTGIGVIIAVGQLKDFFGLTIHDYPAEFLPRITSLASGLTTFSPIASTIGIFTLVTMLVLRKFLPRIPAALTAVVLGALATEVFNLPIETIGSRFGAMPKGLPTIMIPNFSLNTIRAVFPSALTIALLGGIESLLSAVVADGMTGHRHNSNGELAAQGIGNILSSLFGGIPATGAIARTATNIKSGGQTPVSGIVHAFVLLVFTLFLADFAVAIPLASLSGVLLIVAWDMSEVRRFWSVRLSPRSDLLVMLLTFGLTVLIDLTVAVQAGLLVSVLLFVRRVMQTTEIRPIVEIFEDDNQDPLASPEPMAIPKGVEIYEIDGPFFFGTADMFQDTIANLETPPRVFILRMRKVPAMDATALNALDSFRKRYHHLGTQLILSGVGTQPRKALSSIGFVTALGEDNVCSTMNEALDRAKVVLGET
ncbi:MAG: STAS domain-containing protein [Spirochaetales bacterium]|nr:STAS domain-containing protein [Spirochaetales bacterium]